jgi:putative FmdB family regulatory protein
VLTDRPIAEDYVPTYEYVCTDCGSDLEAVQTFSEPSLSECPTCGGTLRKRFGAVGVVFKGSGFYRNDSRSEARNGSSEHKSDSEKADKSDKAGSADKPEKPDKAAKTETKSEPAAAKSGSDSSRSSSGSGSGSGSSNGSSSTSSSTPKASSAA